MSQIVLQTDSLTKRFGDFTALSECDVVVNEGEVVGLLGPNGSGKTTLLRLILGFLNPTAGTAQVQGLDCYRDRVQVHRLISYLPGDARLFRTMRARQVVKFFAEIRDDMDFEMAQGLAGRLELDLNRWVTFMSTGMRQKLALVVSLSSRAPILLLDEPTANLDPSVRGEVLNLVRQARDEGRTVILSSHVLSEIEETCDRVLILRQGRLVHDQSITDLKRQHRIRARLVGDLPEVPAELRSKLSIIQQDGKLQIETPAQLSLVMSWLSGAPLDDVYIQPVSLRAVYDRFHSEWVEDEK